jgi:hypothetical protein
MNVFPYDADYLDHNWFLIISENICMTANIVMERDDIDWDDGELCANPNLEEYLTSKMGRQKYEVSRYIASCVNDDYSDTIKWKEQVEVTPEEILSRDFLPKEGSNPNLTLDFVINNQDLEWDYTYLFMNPSINPNRLISLFNKKIHEVSFRTKLRNRNIRWYDIVYDVNSSYISLLYNSLNGSNSSMKIQHVFRRWRRKVRLETILGFLHNIEYGGIIPLEVCFHIATYTIGNSEFFIRDEYYYMSKL